MDALAPYRIPAAAFRAEEASFDWDLGPDFFNLFDQEHDPILGQFHVGLELHKLGGIATLEFTIEGTYQTECDRCTVMINLPISGQYQLIVKPGDPAESTDEIIFVDAEAPELNVGQLLYDFILLSIPISHRIEGCETMTPSPCDSSILAYLSQNNENFKPSDEDESSSLWDKLKNVMKN